MVYKLLFVSKVSHVDYYSFLSRGMSHNADVCDVAALKCPTITRKQRSQKTKIQISIESGNGTYMLLCAPALSSLIVKF